MLQTTQKIFVLAVSCFLASHLTTPIVQATSSSLNPAASDAASSLVSREPVSSIPVISISQLPPEARVTLTRIDRGGPFPYAKDGTIFGNRERRLPSAPRGYYREYTVPTPGIRTRGARRIVTGQQREAYYTADHYQSFARIRR